MSELFIQVLNRSISASWLILVVLLLRFALKKAPKWVMILLWAVVAVRLISPVSLESALSLIPSAETIRPEILLDTTPQIDSGIASIDSAVNPLIIGSNTPVDGASVNPLQIRFAIEANIWLLGMGGLLAYAAVSYWHLRRKLASAVRLRDNVFQSEYVESPFVLGLARPRIYLPYKMAETELSFVLAHERAHISRKDHWWKPLGYLVLSIHWFNPMVWLAYILLCRDIELACDEKVIGQMDEAQRADYSQSLLNCSVSRRSIRACPLAFGEVGVKQRIKTVLNYRKPAFWLVLVTLILSLAIAVCFLTDPRKPGLGQDRELCVQQVVYRNPNVHSVGIHTFTYRLAEETLYVMELPGSDKWGRLGMLKEEPLSEENFDAYFKETGWSDTANSPAMLRESAAGAWRLDVSPTGFRGLFYLFLKMEDGTEYLLCGYDDHVSTPAEDAGSTVHWVAQMTQSLPEMIRVDGMLYLGTGKAIPAEIDPSAILGEVSYNVGRLQRPQSDGHANFDSVGAPYARVEKGIAVQIDGEWYLFTPDPDRQDRYYLTIAAEGVVSIEVHTAYSSGGMMNAEGSPFTVGEQVWIERLDGMADLRGVTVKALDGEGKVLYSLSVPKEAQGTAVRAVSGNGWLLAPKGILPEEAWEIQTPLVMVPTDAKIDGIFDRYLYLERNGQKYRYEHQDVMPVGIHAGPMITVLTEDTGVQSYTWEIFSVENCTDDTQVLAYCKELEQTCLYSYSPSKAAEEAALQQVIEAELVVLENGDVTAGQDAWDDFYKAALEGKASQIKVAHYHTLDPERCDETYYEAYKEDYPSLQVYTVSFGEEKYTLSWEEAGVVQTRAYDHLLKLTDSDPSSYGALNPGEYTRYVLVNEAGVTWDDLFQSMTSSQAGVVIDHFIIYVDVQ